MKSMTTQFRIKLASTFLLIFLGACGLPSEKRHGLVEAGVAASELQMLEPARQYRLSAASEALRDEAQRLWDEGHFDQASMIWTELARNGVPHGQYGLARALRLGRGITQDAQRAAALFAESASVSSSVRAGAQHNLADMILTGEIDGNDQLATELLRAAADTGRIEALRDLGLLLIQSDAVEMRLEGQENLNRAADRGDTRAMLGLSDALGDNGRLPSSPAQAQQWQARALSALQTRAAAGDADAAYELADFYLDPQSDHYRPTEGLRLLRQAATPARVYALTRLGEALLQGLHVERNRVEADRYLLEAKSLGDARAARLLGDDMIATGRDPVTGAQHLRWAAERGDATAMALLGRSILAEHPPHGETSEAAAWLERAESAGHPSAAEDLAYLSLETPASRYPAEEAISRLRGYAESGDRNAMLTLARTYRDGAPDVAVDREAAERWFDQAGDTESIAAMWFSAGQNASGEAAAALYRKAAVRGHVAGAAALGRGIIDGDFAGTQSEGEDWLREAANRGHQSAQAALARLAETAEDGAAEELTKQGLRLISEESGHALERGRDQLARASRTGDLSATAALGQSLILQTPHDLDRGYDLLAQASEEGRTSESIETAWSILSATPDAHAAGLAVSLLHRAIEAGERSAAYRLGIAYRDGIGISADADAASWYLEQAADRGHGGAMSAIARTILADATSSDEEIHRAIALLADAARQGHEGAFGHLAETYLRFSGVDHVDREVAESWLRDNLEAPRDTTIQTLVDLMTN